VNLNIYEWLHLVIKIEIITLSTELVAVCKKREFNLENLTINSTLKQSKSIEITKDLVLIL
jgi:hypothetical protein